jgi:hypothetical protein
MDYFSGIVIYSSYLHVASLTGYSHGNWQYVTGMSLRALMLNIEPHYMDELE